MTILNFFIKRGKKLAVVKRLFWQLRRAVVAVAVVERWPLWRGLNKSQCVDCPPGQNKLAVVERWPL